jgi:hypothetical protein
MLCYRLLFRGAPISAQAHFKLVLDIYSQRMKKFSDLNPIGTGFWQQLPHKAAGRRKDPELLSC